MKRPSELMEFLLPGTVLSQSHPYDTVIAMRGIISIIIGVLLIIGGLSGRLVLRGTHSNMGIVIVGAVIAVIGVFRVIRSSN